ncbi:PREDICTED: uncharacterized protein LOC108548335 [Eufriesea mexicana]|uniref:uncharacterized protein LOC108548335 n=1 Tax=Eufriesea mexicana TaxID=516756 RepID=UPI00083C5BF0|nr:PREDICTED: uncharacterized protein LOC108548335 [Eufriesea mexicana]
MPSSYRAIIILFVVIAVHAATLFERKPTCNCIYCDDEVENSMKEANKNSTSASQLYKEDSDGDGNPIICARDRDFNDRTFWSVCHMLCYNRCLLLRHSTVTVNGEKKYVAMAYRNNYYKLREGKC